MEPIRSVPDTALGPSGHGAVVVSGPFSVSQDPAGVDAWPESRVWRTGLTQPPEHEPPRERETQREVIVTERRSSGGMILGAILAVRAIVLVIWLIMGMGGEDGADVIPDDVNVDVDVSDATGGGEG